MEAYQIARLLLTVPVPERNVIHSLWLRGYFFSWVHFFICFKISLYDLRFSLKLMGQRSHIYLFYILDAPLKHVLLIWSVRAAELAHQRSCHPFHWFTIPGSELTWLFLVIYCYSPNFLLDLLSNKSVVFKKNSCPTRMRNADRVHLSQNAMKGEHENLLLTEQSRLQAPSIVTHLSYSNMRCWKHCFWVASWRSSGHLELWAQIYPFPSGRELIRQHERNWGSLQRQGQNFIKQIDLNVFIQKDFCEANMLIIALAGTWLQDLLWYHISHSLFDAFIQKPYTTNPNWMFWWG